MLTKLHMIGLLAFTLIVTEASAEQVTVSSGNSVDLTAHRRPYTTVLKLGKQGSDVVGAAIVSGLFRIEGGEDQILSHALVFYSDNTWSTGATHRVDSFGGGKYVLPQRKQPKDILGVGSSGGGVFVWFRDGTACFGRFPSSNKRVQTGTIVHTGWKTVSRLNRRGTIHCGLPDKGGKYYGFSVARGRKHIDIVGVGVDSSNDLVFAYYRDGTVSAGTSD